MDLLGFIGHFGISARLFHRIQSCTGEGGVKFEPLLGIPRCVPQLINFHLIERVAVMFSPDVGNHHTDNYYACNCIEERFTSASHFAPFPNIFESRSVRRSSRWFAAFCRASCSSALCVRSISRSLRAIFRKAISEFLIFLPEVFAASWALSAKLTKSVTAVCASSGLPAI